MKSSFRTLSSYIKKVIDQCDYYVLLIAGRYGSVADDGVSYTEKEFNYALSKGITILAFPHKNPGSLPRDNTEIKPDMAAKLEEFRKKASTNRLVYFWDNKDMLRANVIISLTKAFGERPGLGWIRANSAASTDILGQINDLRIANAELEKALKEITSKSMPKIENLASLNDKFVIKFSYETLHSDERLTGKILQTWREIFCYIGPNMFAPASISSLSELIVQLIREKSNFTIYEIRVITSVVNEIKIHLSNLSYVNFYSERSSAGDFHELMEITETGRNVIAQEMAIKRADAN